MSGCDEPRPEVRIASSNGLVQASLPEWMSPTWMTSCTLGSALIVSMNAGVASNSAFFGKAGFVVVSQYGESPYTASVSVFGLPPAEAAAATTANNTDAAPSAMNLLIRHSSSIDRPLPHDDATKRPSAGGLPARFEVVTKLVRADSNLRSCEATRAHPCSTPRKGARPAPRKHSPGA